MLTYLRFKACQPLQMDIFTIFSYQISWFSIKVNQNTTKQSRWIDTSFQYNRSAMCDSLCTPQRWQYIVHWHDTWDYRCVVDPLNWPYFSLNSFFFLLAKATLIHVRAKTMCTVPEQKFEFDGWHLFIYIRRLSSIDV